MLIFRNAVSMIGFSRWSQSHGTSELLYGSLYGSNQVLVSRKDGLSLLLSSLMVELTDRQDAQDDEAQRGFGRDQRNTQRNDASQKGQASSASASYL
jgi:hypothetical protein